MLRVGPGVSLAIILSALLCGQSSTNQPVFEVADVHSSPRGASQTDGGIIAGGRFEMRGATMLDLISEAYGIDPKVVVGGPGWLNSDRFDIVANAPPGVTSAEVLRAMLKSLLAERFKLVTHQDQMEMPVYVLTVGKKGAKLRAAAKAAPPKTSQGAGEPALNNHVVCTSYTMAALAELLPVVAKNFFDHPVVDRTELKGSYDFQLDWMGWAPYNAAKANPDGPMPVSAFDAVKKLGLNVDLGTRPMPVLVMDAVNETPAPNPAGVAVKMPTFPARFDAAEVRPAKPGAVEGAMGERGGVIGQVGPMGLMHFENGRLEILGATLRGLIMLAYDIDNRWIVGAEKWIGEDRFDIIAKAPSGVTEDALKVMVKNLIVERFKLAAHTEDRPMPVYVLTAGKKPKLKQSDGTERSECSIVLIGGERTFVCKNTTMAQFAERLPAKAAAYIHPPLLDFTGLKGAYDFEVYWTPKALLPAGRSGDPEAAAQASIPAGDVTVFEAVDKQLGLKLEEQRHPVPALVIDRVNRTPSEN